MVEVTVRVSAGPSSTLSRLMIALREEEGQCRIGSHRQPIHLDTEISGTREIIALKANNSSIMTIN